MISTRPFLVCTTEFALKGNREADGFNSQSIHDHGPLHVRNYRAGSLRLREPHY